MRVATGDGATQRLTDEESVYRGFDAAHFAAMDVPLGAVGVAAPDRPGVVAGLEPYFTAVDLPIVRALAGPDLASLVAVAEAAATR